MNTLPYPGLRAIILWGTVIAVLLVGVYVSGYLWRTQLLPQLQGRPSWRFSIANPGPPPRVRFCKDSWGEWFWRPAALVEGALTGADIRLRHYNLPGFLANPKAPK